MIYEIPKNEMIKDLYILRNKSDWIPKNPDNVDYQAYLKWVAEGNTPEPADE